MTTAIILVSLGLNVLLFVLLAAVGAAASAKDRELERLEANNGQLAALLGLVEDGDNDD